MPKFSTLTLGSRKDTDWWRRGMKEKVLATERIWVKKPEPTMDEMKSVFADKDDWLFFGGHFSLPFLDSGDWGAAWPYPTEWRLYNDLDDNAHTPPTREVLTRDSEVLLRLKKPAGTWEEQKLQKGSGFKQTKTGCVLLWGGCNVCEDATITTLRKLYDKPLIIGWKSTTSRQIISMMLGGTGDNDATGNFTTLNFWTKLGSDAGDLVKVRKAWLAAADEIWPTDTFIRNKFCVIDPDGTSHSL